MVLLILLLTMCIIYWVRSVLKHRAEPPLLSRCLPIVGHAYEMTGDAAHSWEFIQRISLECIKAGHVLTLKQGPIKFYVLSDPDDCMTIGNTFLQKSYLYDFAKPWLGDGLVTASMSKWKTHRKILNPVFNKDTLNGFLPIFNSQSRHLVEEMSKEAGKQPFDCEKYVKLTSLETIYLTATGIDLREKANLNIKFMHAIDTALGCLSYRLMNVWAHSNFLWNLCKQKTILDENIEYMHSISDMILKRRKENDVDVFDVKGEKLRTFSDIFFDLHHESGDRVFMKKDVTDHLDTLLTAGYDTISYVLLLTTVLIGSYPKTQDKVLAELREIFGDTGRDVKREDLPRLVYLEAVIKESMRMYPIVAILARNIEKDIKIKNYSLNAGNTCLLTMYGITRHPMWGKDVDVFRPERWLDSATLPKNANLFVGFGLGKRDCIGKTYAMMWMKTVLSHVLLNYRVQGDHTKIVMNYAFIANVKEGQFISIEKRCESLKPEY